MPVPNVFEHKSESTIISRREANTYSASFNRKTGGKSQLIYICSRRAAEVDIHFQVLISADLSATMENNQVMRTHVDENDMFLAY